MIGNREFPKKVTIFEVGPRDGLQNECKFIPTEKKVEFINKLTEAGCKRIEVTSFVHPKWVPQLKDAKEVCANIHKRDGVIYSALIPNLRGLEFAMKAELEEVVTIISASESHNRRNLNSSVAESLQHIKEINEVATQNKIRVRSYIATCFGCPIEGFVSPKRIVEIAETLERYGAYEVSLGDTTGMVSPIQAYAFPKLLLTQLKRASVAVHFHRCEGIEFANVVAALRAGITTIDGATGGLGGCPYAPGATGNVATETLVEMFERIGIATGIDKEKIRDCADFARGLSSYFQGQKH